MKWFRSHHGAPFDTKLAVVARRANVTRGNAASVWWAILDHASSHNPRGFVGEVTAEEIAAAFDYDEAEVQSILDAMREKGLLITADGKVSGWDEKQIQGEDNSKERVALHRERKRGVTQGNAEAERATHGNGPEGEGERDKEEESCADSSGDEPDATRSTLPKSLQADFDEWWKVYPLRKGKIAAEKQYLKVRRSGVTQQQLIEGTKRYIAKKHPDTPYKYPQGWLSEGRWDDEYEATPGAPRMSNQKF